MKSTVPSSTFLTDSYQSKDRIDAYRESIGVVFDVERIEKEDFKAKIQGYLISDLMLVDCQTVEQDFLRPISKIARDGMDHFLIQLFLGGGTGFELMGERYFCDTSKLIVIDASRPWSAHNPGFRNLTLVIPRRFLRSKLWDEDLHHGRILDPQKNPFAELLRSHILSLHKTIGDIETDMAHSLIDPTVDLVAMAMNYSTQGEKEKPGNGDALYNRTFLFRIKTFIEENLSNPNLNMEIILAEFNLTRSTLYRLFPSSGGVMKYVRERRLKKAFKLLTMPQYFGESISHLAHGLGFENESSFTRTFKNYFGVLPSEVRKGQSYLTNSLGESPQRVWEAWLLSL